MKRKRRPPTGKPPKYVSNPLGTIAGQAIPVMEALRLAVSLLHLRRGAYGYAGAVLLPGNAHGRATIRP